MSRIDSPTMQTGSSLSLQSCPLPLPNPQLQRQDDRFRFTPVKASRVAPRAWDRKPSTAYMGRARSRKVWKRFRSSFNSQKALQQMIDDDQKVAVDDLYVEINSSRNPDFLRGVKRQCLTLGEQPHSSNATSDEHAPRGRSFLETKWESEASGRRRKLPANHHRLVADSEPMDLTGELADEAQDEITESDIEQDMSTSADEVVQPSVEEAGSSGLTPDTPTRLAPSPAYHRPLHGQPRQMAPDAADIKPPVDTVAPPLLLAGPDPLETTPLEDPREDAVLTATMAADRPDDASPPATVVAQDLTAEQESTLVRSALRSSLDGDDTELLNNFLSKAKAKREAKAAALVAQEPPSDAPPTPDPEREDMPTPPARRALEDLDANSPSPQKSPVKALRKPAVEEQPPASPRRSTRTRTAKQSTRSAAAAAVRSTFSLRRAKGTEFVFLQRTEAQELALTTRRNTRHNKGEALLPKYALPALARSPSDDDPSDRRPSSSQKRVSWNDDRLAQYEGEESTTTGSTVGDQKKKKHADDVAGRRTTSKAKDADPKRRPASSRSTRSQGEPVPADDLSASTPRARRVRRVGASAESSPADHRKKLTPKSPKAGTPVAKKVASTKTLSMGGSASKSASLLQAHAGSTPMPRRVRTRS